MDTNGISARVTTRKKLANLVSRGLIEDRKKKANGFHFYFPSSKNDFTVIHNGLLRISNIIGDLYNIVPFISNNDGSLELDKHFADLYLQIISSMLRTLLLRTFLTSFSEVDSQMLYSIIIKLMIKLDLEPYNLGKARNLLSAGTQKLNIIRKELSHELTGKRSFLDIHILNNLQKEISFFQKDVLPWFANYENYYKSHGAPH